jgi:hypothetical protein
MSSVPIILVDGSIVIISGENLDDFCTLQVLSQMSKWFSANKLSLNIDKTNAITFVTKRLPMISIKQ